MTKGIRFDYVIKDEEYVFTTTGFLFAAKPFDLTGHPRRLRFSVRIRKGELRVF